MLEIQTKIQDVDLLQRLQKQEVLVINSRHKNGVIIYKRYHAEFAGPGSLIGGSIDADLVKILSVGELTINFPETAKERIAAYLMRRQWNRLIKQITDESNPLERAQLILNQFEHWFDKQTMTKIPDDAFGLLVGVFPQTVRSVRFL
ncbi:MAG: hypothetical protein EA365_01675 [Gloeocapsa sp. DLM2.Bin57]|nr:MAG: hypothetical protein EA365_01675 [Gloeocapsa sp. DLM2.Bin57]